MLIKIQHGIPQSNYFIIAQPKREYNEPRIGIKDATMVKMTDPKSKEPTDAILVDTWTMEMKELEEMNSLALLAYGITGAQLKTLMLQKYPELNQNSKVEYWLMKRL